MKQWRILALTALLLLTLAGCAENTQLRLGTGGESGTYYGYGSALAQQLEEQDKAPTLSVRSTSGSAANLRLMQEGFLQMAIVQSDVLADAVNGTGAFEQTGPCEGVAAVAGLYTETCQIVVNASSGFETVQDLAGKRVSVGEKESGVRKNAEEILQSHGLSLQMIQPSFLSFADSAEALKRGEIDAFFCTAGAPTRAVSELANGTPVRLLSLSEDAVNNLLSLGTGYTDCTVSALTYPGQNEAVRTVGVKAVLVADTGVKEKDVAAITRCLLEEEESLLSAVKLTPSGEPNYAVEDIPCAFHAGSAACYAEQGITVQVASGSAGTRVRAAQD